jgi:hypothetical protein
VKNLNLSDNLNKAASFTGKVFSDIGNLILLIVLNIIPIVNLIVLGYMAKIIRESPDEPPKLSDYGKLFVDGLLVLIAGTYIRDSSAYCYNCRSYNDGIRTSRLWNGISLLLYWQEEVSL